MAENSESDVIFHKKIVILGFGSIGQAILPLLFRHFKISPKQLTIITKKTDGHHEANQYGVELIEQTITKENYRDYLTPQLNAGDFLLNLSVDVSSIDLIKLCQERHALYLDTCIEPWAGGYTDPAISPSERSNYALRETALALKKTSHHQTTAVITHGANPGLVSHFVKQALINIANDNGLTIKTPATRTEWALLAQQLGIKVIHVAEHDSQITAVPKRKNEFVNTWSVDGFVSEGSQPAELGWGSHEKEIPHDGHQHNFGCQSAIYLNRAGAATRVRTWTPLAGSFHGFLITHGESISIADYYTLKAENEAFYRPTVHYAYHPCEDAVLSLHELAGREWQQQPEQRVLADDIIDGMDELGVLLMGNKKGAYWFGSHLSIHEARELAPFNTATSLQVAIGVLAGMKWAIEHPNAGIVEPDDIDFNYIMQIALPYLGKVSGFYTDWNPLEGRERLFPEQHIDKTDPWQFINIRVV
jgi:homospermidine synthase